MRVNATLMVLLSLVLAAGAFGEETGVSVDTSNPAVDVYCPSGGVKMVSFMKAADAPCRVKTAAFLSISESPKLPAEHVPVLGMYSTNDHLGDSYKRITKIYVESILTEPKKMVAIDGTPHGDELVADAATKDAARGQIDAWLKEKL
jgi:hypothetical protein